MISNELKTQIQGAYSRFLEAKGLKARYGQRLMIAEIAKARHWVGDKMTQGGFI